MIFVESAAVELKEKVSNYSDVSKVACAFANAQGGKVVVGVKNNGIVVGVPEADFDQVQQKLENAVQCVSPIPFHKIETVKEQEKTIVILEVYQIGEGAFCTFGGIVYYRFGSQVRKLEGKTLQDYIIHRRILMFDETKSEAKLDDLDDKKISSYLESRTPNFVYQPKNKESVLTTLGVVKRNGDFWVKNTAVLLFARETERFLPQNELKLVRFHGTEPVEIVNSQFIHKTLLENLNHAEDFIKLNTKTRFQIKGLERKEVPEYPETVVREALVNAVTHRDYFSKDAIQINIFDDRLEIISPGGLPQGLSMKLLGTLSIQRNPLTYRLLRDIRLVEGLGTGIPRMRKEMLERRLPEPLFEDLGSFFKLTLYNKVRPKETLLNPRQEKALSYLRENKSITAKIYAKLTGVSQVTAVKDLNTLAQKGNVQKIGKTRSAYYILKESLS